MTSSDTERPILLAADDSNDVFAFWRFHKQCRIHNRLEVLSDGEDVVRYLESKHPTYPLPALLVAALSLPHMGGLQLLQHLQRTRQREFSTVLMIDVKNHDLELSMQAYRLGAYAFLFRPLMKKEFYGLMSRCEGIKMEGCLEERGPDVSARSPV